MLRLPPPDSLAAKLALLPPPERAKALAGLSDRHAQQILYEWEFWARSGQREPVGDWFVWLRLTGRGEGKTRTGAEFARRRAAMFPRGALVGRTAADVRDVMVEGESGILATSPPWFRPVYEPSKRKVTWPNGAVAHLYSADKPALLRGPQHYWGWADEVAAWRYDEAWDNLMLGLRLGPDPRVLATTTPKPVKVIKDLVDPHGPWAGTVALTGGTTWDNLANLSPKFIRQVVNRYAGTRLAAQELEGKLIEDNPAAPWRRAWLDRDRVASAPPLKRIVVAVDPPGSAGEEAAECGITAGGVTEVAGRAHGFLLADASGHFTPEGWAREAVRLLNVYRGDAIVAEKNYGGDMVASTIRSVDDRVRVKVVTASRGKEKRAEPVVSLYEQGLVHHVGRFPEIEDQMCQVEWGDDEALQDRRDSAVWLWTELLLEGEAVYGKTYGIG